MVGFRGELCGVDITLATTLNIVTDLENARATVLLPWSML